MPGYSVAKCAIQTFYILNVDVFGWYNFLLIILLIILLIV